MPEVGSYVFGILATAMSMTAFVPYFRSTVRGETRPSGASWWTWTLLTVVTLASSWYAGADWGVLVLPGWLCMAQLVIAVLSLTRGNNNWDALNKMCVAGGCLGLVLWLATAEPLLALIFAIAADLLATVPTFRHAWSLPAEENRLAWTLGWCSSLLLLFAIRDWDIANGAWAIYFTACMTVILILVWRPSIVRIERA